MHQLKYEQQGRFHISQKKKSKCCFHIDDKMTCVSLTTSHYSINAHFTHRIKFKVGFICK